MSVLAPFNLPGKFRKGNIHTHSNLSDGALSPAHVVAEYKNAGYDFLMLSEHFAPMYDWPIADTQSFQSEDFTTIIGAELHAPKTNVGEMWHILACGLSKRFRRPDEFETGPEIAKRAVNDGAFVSIAHPAWSQLDLDDGLNLDCAHAVEVYNHGCEVECGRGLSWSFLDQLLNSGRRMTAIATDDAHFIHGARDAFGGWVNVTSNNLEPGELLNALKQGHFYSSQGPEFYSLELNRSELQIDCSPVNRIIVVTGTSRTQGHFGENMTNASFNLAELHKGWLLEKPSSWFRVVITDSKGCSAWSNPYWFDEL